VALLDGLSSEHPEDLEALDLLGFALYFAGRPAEAETACRRALALDPGHAYAHKGLGLCLAAQGRLAEGRQSLERAIALKPEWADPRWDLTVVLLRAGHRREAAEVLSRAERELPAEAARWRRLRRNP